MYRIILFATFFITTWCSGQMPKIVFEHYGLQQGFNSRVCRSVVKTANGMIWISTEDGLARYDSKKFTFFQHDATDSQSVASNFTDQVILDKNNRIWLVAGRGLDVFDSETGVFKHCYITRGKEWIKDFNPESLFYDSIRNKIWVGTWMGLYYVDPDSTELRKAPMHSGNAAISEMTFIDIAADKKQNLWLCNTYGFFKYEIITGKYTWYHVPEHRPNMEGDDGVFCIYADDDDSTLWLGTWMKGLVRFNTVSNSGQHYYYSDKTKEQNGIRHITKTGLAQQQHILWVSSATSGLASFNKQTGKFNFYTVATEYDKNGIKGMTNRMLPTSTEGMWIASENGLHRYDYSRQLFSEIDLGRFNTFFNKAFAAEEICLQKSSTGKDSLCWFNVPYMGTHIYDLSKQKLYQPDRTLQKYLEAAVYAMYIDSDNTLWIGTDQYGLVGYHITTRKITFAPNQFFFQGVDRIAGFFEDSKKQLWLATYSGLYMMDRIKKQPVAVLAVNKGLAAHGISTYILNITEDASGKIWLIAGGSLKYKDAVGVYDTHKNNAAFFYDDGTDTFAIFKDLTLNDIECNKDDIYVSSTSGILHFKNNRSNPTFELLTVKNGLANNNIEDLVKDKDNNIWCSSTFGISCYLPDKNFFINYSYGSSGLGPEKKPRMYLSAGSNTIYLGQQGAINFFNPSAITVSSPPKVYFTDLHLFNKPFNVNGRQPQAGDVIPLRHFENMLTIEFAAMSFSNSEDNQYAYMLEGLEKEWTISKSNKVTYTNLAPGKNKLLVKASNSLGVWNTQPVSLTFIISPPFWKSWWFILLMVLTISTALYALYRYRIQQLLQVQRLQNTISRNLHDEIGSTLTSISILSNVSQQAMEKEPEQAKEMLRKISLQSKSIQQNMSDIVWAIRSENDKIENLLVRMREYAAQTLEPLNILTTISINESLLNRALGMQARKELLLIYKEAVNNIARHSGATEANITVHQSMDLLRLTIEDNGKWKGRNSSSGTGIGSMQQRARSINGECKIAYNDQGTVLTVVMPIT